MGRSKEEALSSEARRIFGGKKFQMTQYPVGCTGHMVFFWTISVICDGLPDDKANS